MSGLSPTDAREAMERLKTRMQERLAAGGGLGAAEGGERTVTDALTGSLLQSPSIRSLRAMTLRGKELETLARGRDRPGLLPLDRW